MGDAADALIEDGESEYIAHLAGECDGPCPYCDEEERKEKRKKRKTGENLYEPSGLMDRTMRCRLCGKVMRAGFFQHAERHEREDRRAKRPLRIRVGMTPLFGSGGLSRYTYTLTRKKGE